MIEGSSVYKRKANHKIFVFLALGAWTGTAAFSIHVSNNRNHVLITVDGGLEDRLEFWGRSTYPINRVLGQFGQLIFPAVAFPSSLCPCSIAPSVNNGAFPPPSLKQMILCHCCCSPALGHNYRPSENSIRTPSASRQAYGTFLHIAAM